MPTGWYEHLFCCSSVSKTHPRGGEIGPHAGIGLFLRLSHLVMHAHIGYLLARPLSNEPLKWDSLGTCVLQGVRS